MPINSFLYPGASGPPAPYEVANSLRFNGSGSDDYLTRSLSSDGNKKIWTCSAWVKRSELGRTQVIFFAGNDGQDSYPIYFRSDDRINSAYYSGGFVYRLETNALFRDVSAWLHIVVAFDSTQSTESDRVKMYVNGSQITSLATASYPSLNDEYSWNNSSYNHRMGFQTTNNDFDYGGYMAEVVHIDGQALDPTSFGEFDSDSPNIWKPIDVSGLTFGTNGFYLDFENASSLGADVSGNSNNFTVNNLTSIDQSTDTCTNNFAVLNPLAIPTSGGANTFSNGNLEITNSADAFRTSFSTIGVSSGKWYWEAKFLSGEMKQYIGISKPQDTMDYLGQSANSYSYQGENGRKNNNGSHTAGYGSSASTGDIIMVAFDADNGAIWVGKNGTWFSSATQAEIEAGTTTNAMYSSITIDDFFVVGATVEDSNIQMNFGSPMYSISSGNSDGNGYGNFEYAVPSGYYALNTKNLAEYG